MLNPRAYPELVAKALVLDDEPFVIMADDDDPWVEGLVLTTLIGVIAGIAQFIGSLLTATSLPAPDLVLTTFLQGWRQFSGALSNISVDSSAQAEAVTVQIWHVLSVYSGYAGGWSHITLLILTPALALTWWLFFGFVAHTTARAMGGRGKLTTTLGAAALIVAPNTLLFLSFVPFVSVSSVLLSVWGTLIGFRAIQVAQGLPWSKAAIAALAPLFAAAAAIILVAIAFGLGYTAGGYR